MKTSKTWRDRSATLTILGGIVGVVVLVMAIHESIIFQNASTTPTVAAVSDLTPKGVNGNLHVSVTDFEVMDQFVYEIKDGSWTKVWLVAVPIDKTKPMKQPVLFESGRHRNEAEVGSLANQREVTGVITNDVASLGKREREKLVQIIPGLDVDSAVIVDVGRSVPTETKLAALYAVGGLSLLGCMMGAVYLWKTRQVAGEQPIEEEFDEDEDGSPGMRTRRRSEYIRYSGSRRPIADDEDEEIDQRSGIPPAIAVISLFVGVIPVMGAVFGAIAILLNRRPGYARLGARIGFALGLLSTGGILLLMALE